VRAERNAAVKGAAFYAEAMRHAQVSTTMQYGNAYMTEKRKAHGAVVQMVLPAKTATKAEITSLSA
jgi:hypothetical protein